MQKREKHFVWPYSYPDLLVDFLQAPENLERCITYYFSETSQKRFQQLTHLITAHHITKVLFIGNTLNYFASFIPRYCFLKNAEPQSISWECYEMTEFFDYMLPEKREPTLYIFISHSGKSRLLIKCLEHLHLLNVPSDTIWMVTNAKPEEMNSIVGQYFPINVESELVIGVKSFQNEVVVLYLLAQLLLNKNPFTPEIYTGLQGLISGMTLFREHWLSEIEKFLKFLEYRLDFLYFIARDPASLACAKLSALRAKTYHHQFAEGTSFGLFFHGPFQIFDRNQNRQQGAILLVGSKTIDREADQDMLLRLVRLIRERAGRIIILSNNPILRQWFQDVEEILIIDFNAPIEELAPVFENFILALAFLQVAKRDFLLK